jgi:hypothetical protein
MSIPLELGFWNRKTPVATNNHHTEKWTYTRKPMIPFLLTRINIVATIVYSSYIYIKYEKIYMLNYIVLLFSKE